MQGKAETKPATALYAGIDVSKAKLDAQLHEMGERLQVANDTGGHGRLVERLKSHGVVRVMMEPTSHYHRDIHRQLHEAGIGVVLINPLRARLFAQACGKLAKTDAIDAAMLARMAAQTDLEPVAPPSAVQQELQELTSARRAAIAERVALNNRHGATTNAFLKRELANRLRSLIGHIARLETRIEALIKTDPDMSRKARILRSIPGVGPVTTQALLAQLAELGQMSAKQVAAITGLAPFARDSGTMQGKRHIHGGRADLRSALYMAALTASRKNPDMKRFYQALIARGKAAKVALAAVARKIVVLANSLVTQNRSWKLQPA
jgi:transposase